jgi:hypothetical protein
VWPTGQFARRIRHGLQRPGEAIPVASLDRRDDGDQRATQPAELPRRLTVPSLRRARVRESYGPVRLRLRVRLLVGAGGGPYGTTTLCSGLEETVSVTVQTFEPSNTDTE